MITITNKESIPCTTPSTGKSCIAWTDYCDSMKPTSTLHLTKYYHNNMITLTNSAGLP
jgi:hypothetical protein